MREIKFKFWNSRNKKMIENRHGLAISPNGKVSKLIGYDDYLEWEGTDLSEHIVPVEWTGLKDKNGVDLYEGDIFKDCEGYILQVVYHRQGFQSLGLFNKSYQGEKYVSKSYNYLGNDTKDKRWGIEIIGNIYENPELLEVKQ